MTLFVRQDLLDILDQIKQTLIVRKGNDGEKIHFAACDEFIALRKKMLEQTAEEIELSKDEKRLLREASDLIEGTYKAYNEDHEREKLDWKELEAGATLNVMKQAYDVTFIDPAPELRDLASKISAFLSRADASVVSLAVAQSPPTTPKRRTKKQSSHLSRKAYDGEGFGAAASPASSVSLGRSPAATPKEPHQPKPSPEKADWELAIDEAMAKDKLMVEVGYCGGAGAGSSAPVARAPSAKFYGESEVDHLIISTEYFGKRPPSSKKPFVRSLYLDFKLLLKGGKATELDVFKDLLGTEDSTHLLNSLVVMLSSEKDLIGVADLCFRKKDVPIEMDEKGEYWFVPSTYLLAQNHRKAYDELMKGGAVHRLSPRVFAHLVSSFSHLIRTKLLYEGGCAKDVKGYLSLLDGLLAYNLESLSPELLDVVAGEVYYNFASYSDEVTTNSKLARVVVKLVVKLNQILAEDSKYKDSLADLDAAIKAKLIDKKAHGYAADGMAASADSLVSFTEDGESVFRGYFFLSGNEHGDIYNQIISLINSEPPSDFTLAALERILSDGTKAWKLMLPNTVVVVKDEGVISDGLSQGFFRDLLFVREQGKGYIAVPIIYGLISAHPNEFYNLLGQNSEGINYLLPRVYAALLASCLFDYLQQIYLCEQVAEKPELIRFLRKFQEYDYRHLNDEIIIAICAAILPLVRLCNVLILNDEVVAPLFVPIIARLCAQCAANENIFITKVKDLFLPSGALDFEGVKPAGAGAYSGVNLSNLALCMASRGRPEKACEDDGTSTCSGDTVLYEGAEKERDESLSLEAVTAARAFVGLSTGGPSKSRDVTQVMGRRLACELDEASKEQVGSSSLGESWQNKEKMRRTVTTWADREKKTRVREEIGTVVAM